MKANRTKPVTRAEELHRRTASPDPRRPRLRLADELRVKAVGFATALN